VYKNHAESKAFKVHCGVTVSLYAVIVNLY